MIVIVMSLCMVYPLYKTNNAPVYANENFHSGKRVPAAVYEDVPEMTPQAPTVYSALDSSTQNVVRILYNWFLCTKRVSMPIIFLVLCTTR